ncbi:hypothetical protein U8V72_25415 [Priestia filamentosa]|uniref:hypothetical protein n=1 Tax=Priestia filamentosa TaxID=1402861 RepID=UPI00397896E4
MNIIYEVAEYGRSIQGPLNVLKWKIYVEDENTASEVYRYLDVPSYKIYTGVGTSVRKVDRSKAEGSVIYNKYTIKEFYQNFEE